MFWYLILHLVYTLLVLSIHSDPFTAISKAKSSDLEVHELFRADLQRKKNLYLPAQACHVRCSSSLVQTTNDHTLQRKGNLNNRNITKKPLSANWKWYHTNLPLLPVGKLINIDSIPTDKMRCLQTLRMTTHIDWPLLLYLLRHTSKHTRRLY